MVIPTPAKPTAQHDRAARGKGDARSWAELDAAEKRERVLAAAGEIFATEGIEAPMPSVAAAAGAGVGSVYRQFPSKEDLLAALVVRRLDTVRCDVEAALQERGEPWSVLVALIWRLADRQASDDVVAEAMATVSEHPEVARRAELCEQRIEQLLGVAREAGTLRVDASARDVRLVLGAVRAVRRREPDSWRRMLELALSGLAARPPSAAS